MNIQKIFTIIALSTGLAILGIASAQADPRGYQYAKPYDSHHHQYKEKHYEYGYRQKRKIRHERKKRVANFKLEHRYQHKNRIPHRNTLGAAHPHKSWRKQHKRWNYAKLNRKYDRRYNRNTGYRTQPHYDQYSYNNRYWH